MSLYKKLILRGLVPVLALTGAYLTIPSEGVEYHPYIDATGTKTVCFGHVSKDIEDRAYSEEECLTLLQKDLTKANKQLHYVLEVPLNNYQEAAMTDFIFNVGIGNYKTSTLLKKLNAGQYEAACHELSRWVFSKKIKLKGLVTRRELEMDYCLGKVKVPEHELEMSKYYK